MQLFNYHTFSKLDSPFLNNWNLMVFCLTFLNQMLKDYQQLLRKQLDLLRDEERRGLSYLTFFSYLFGLKKQKSDINSR